MPRATSPAPISRTTTSSSAQVTVTHSSPVSETTACRYAGRSGLAAMRSAEHVSDALRLTVQHGLVDGLVGGGVDLRGGGEHRAFVLVIGERCARMMTQARVRRVCLVTGASSGVCRIDQPDGQPRHQHRGPSVRHERQRQPGHREQPEVHPDVLHDLHRQPGRDADGDQPPEGVLGPGGHDEHPPHDERQQQEQPGRPDEPELLPRHREDEVVELVGHVAALGALPAHEPLAPHPAGADGQAHHPGLVAAALRVGRRVGERRQPVALVVAEHRRGEGDHHDDQPEQHGPDHPPPRHAGHRDDHRADRDDHRRRAEVRLQQDQRRRQRHEHRGQGHLAAARWQPPLGLPGEQGRQGQAQPHLGQLGGLDGEPADERDPRPRAVHRAAHGRQHRQQQEQRPGVHPRRRQAHPLLADPAHQQRQPQAHRRGEQVPHEVGRAVGARRGRPDEQRADHRGAGGGDVEPDVVPGPGAHVGSGVQAGSARSAAQAGTILVSSSRHRATSWPIASSSSSTLSNFSVGRMCAVNSTMTRSS